MPLGVNGKTVYGLLKTIGMLARPENAASPPPLSQILGHLRRFEFLPLLRTALHILTLPRIRAKIAEKLAGLAMRGGTAFALGRAVVIGGKEFPILGGIASATITAVRVVRLMRKGERPLAAAEAGVGMMESLARMAPLPPGISLAAGEAVRQAAVEAVNYATGIRAQDSGAVSIAKAGHGYIMRRRERKRMMHLALNHPEPEIADHPTRPTEMFHEAAHHRPEGISAGLT